MNDSLQQVITLLQSKHYSEEEIAAVTNDIIMDAYESFVQKAKESLADEDKKAIEAAGESEVEDVINRLYKERTGKDPQDELSELLKQHAESLINEYSDTTLHP